MRFRLLLVDDEAIYLKLMTEFLEKYGYEVETASSGKLALEILNRPNSEFALIILDYIMADRNGIQVAEDILKLNPKQHVIINSTDQSREVLKKSLAARVDEFIDKSASPDEYLKTIGKWCALYKEGKETVKVNSSENSKAILEIGMIGVSNAMANIAALVHKYKQSDRTVVILGESGTGKELIAKAIHGNPSLSFRAINCASYSGDANLMESELFGVEKGAFTGAGASKKGILEEVGNGTVFLDELHTLSYRAQQKLLRVLQEKKIRPVGSNKEIPVNFRLIVAVKPDLDELARTGEFLPDLYFRINVLRIEVPPLRTRPEDIAPLVKFFCDRYNQDTKDHKEFLAKSICFFERYSWPGNIRELENTVERLCATSSEQTIGPDQLDCKFKDASNHLTLLGIKSARSLSVDKNKVLTVLKEAGSQREAARRLGIARSTFHDYLKKLGIAGSDKRASNE